MWKKRESHLLDIYKKNKSKDDSMLPLEKETTDSVYSCSDMSQSQPSLLISNHNSNNKKKEYQGNDFDVFGKEQIEEKFAPLYSIEQFTPTTTNTTTVERYLKGEILLRTEEEFKRGQIESMINDATTTKRRKKSDKEAEEVVLIEQVFMKSTAPVNTPALSMFLVKDNQLEEDDHLEYS